MAEPDRAVVAGSESTRFFLSKLLKFGTYPLSICIAGLFSLMISDLGYGSCVVVTCNCTVTFQAQWFLLVALVLDGG